MAKNDRWINSMFELSRRIILLRNIRPNVTWADQPEKTYVPTIPGGRISFLDEGLESKDSKMEAKYFVINDDTPEYLDVVATDMAGSWNLRTPKLVLSIISSREYYRPWNKPQDEEDFEDGLMMAAKLTDMWIVAGGLHIGVDALIGKAVAKERARRKILYAEQTMVRFLSSERLPRLTVLGVVQMKDLSRELAEDLRLGSLARKDILTMITAGGQEEEELSHQLNPNMTHFFILNENVSLENFVFRLEMRLTRPVGKARRYFNTADSETEAGQTPLVGLLIQGGPKDINHALSLLSRNVPVIVIYGQGMIADILAFAFMSTQNVASSTGKDSYIKAELLRRLAETFPSEFKDDTLARNHCRDRILECVDYATQRDSVLLTLLDSHLLRSEVRDLSKVILTAVLSCRSTQGVQTVSEQVQWNLQLTIDWKRPDLAVSEIFNKYKENILVGYDQFQQVLLSPGRQEFVELFLDRGFILYKYLNSRRLELLFKLCEDRTFFAEICLEIILGKKITLDHPVPGDFLSGRHCLLNQLLHQLTGLKQLIDPLTLSLNASNDRVETAAVAEQRALHAIIYWAALTNNTKLLKILWGRTSEPMAMALVLSTLHSRLSRDWISDPDLKLKIKKIGIEFGQLAVQMLEMSYQESKVQSLDLLTTKIPDFTNYSAVDLAVIGKNKFFIAHPCCQKYAHNLWYGSIRIQKRKLGFIEIPEIIKIFLCLILIFPTYYWIDIVRIYRPQIVHRAKLQVQTSYFGNTSLGARWKREVFLIVKLYHIWAAPITQFWMSQFFILLFLILFAYALSQPYCGDPFIHEVLLAALIVLFVDNLYSLLARKFHCREFTIKQNVRTMFVILYTSYIVVMFRVLHFTTLSFTTVKFLLSLSLIYFFYHAMRQFYPVSQTLGPMLVNITVMMRRDLTNWLKMWVLTLVSGSIAIHAVLYPAENLDLQVAFKTLVRGILALFMTEVEDLEGDSCSCLYNYTTQFRCRDNEIPQIVKDSINTCPHTSAGGYFIVLGYIFQTKLVYNTLIFAICSVTMARTYQKAVEIWKYQFFLLVQEFVRRPPVPIPFVVLVYPAMIIKEVLISIYHFFLTCCPFRRAREKATEEKYNVWNAFLKLHKKQERIAMDKLNENKNTEQRLTVIAKEQKSKDKHISSLNDRLVEVMNSQVNMFLMMENMQNALQSSSKKKTQARGVSSLVESQHTHCRRSPYPATAIRRFAVFDKYLPWEENYPEYDPPIYSRPMEDYDEDMRIYVDPDLIEVMAKREVQDTDSEIIFGTEKVLEFEPKYNAVTEDKAITGEIFTADRISWITKDDQPVQYTVDENGAPRNPMGRTGLRGRGNLWRYGPNHMMYAVVSRWKSYYNADGVAQGSLLVGGKKLLEIMVVNNPMLKEDSLPGGFVSGRTSNYSVMCEVFMRDFLGEKDVPGSLTLDQDDMILFFRQFVSSEFILSGILGLAASTSFSHKLLYRGYMDDPNNTDNAWVEAEVWSFHYHSKDKFDKKIAQREKYWRDVFPWLQLTGCHLPFVKEVQDTYNE